MYKLKQTKQDGGKNVSLKVRYYINKQLIEKYNNAWKTIITLPWSGNKLSNYFLMKKRPHFEDKDRSLGEHRLWSANRENKITPQQYLPVRLPLSLLFPFCRDFYPSLTGLVLAIIVIETTLIQQPGKI